MGSERMRVWRWSLLSFVAGAGTALVIMKAPRPRRRRIGASGGTIKGHNASLLYHPADSPYYRRVPADVWFRTPAEAEAAGFTAWNKRRPGAP